MKPIKNTFYLFIVFCLLYSYGKAELKIFKVSDNVFGVFSILGDSAEIKTYKINKNNFELTDNFKPSFLKNKKIIEKKMTPVGDIVKIFKYNVIGVSGGKYYFRVDTNRLLEYDKYSDSIVNRFFNYPKILIGVYRSDNYFLLFSNMVLDDRSKNECRNKYFILKTLEWKDYGCFGKCKNLMMGFDFPITFVLNRGKSAGVYFPKSSEMFIYNVLTKKLSKTLIIQRNDKILKNNPGKLEHIYEHKDKFCLVKFKNNRVFIYKIDTDKWKLAQEIKGNYKMVVLLNTHIVLSNGEKIDKKKIEF